MGATPNVLSSNLVDAQPMSGLAHVKNWLVQKPFFAQLLRRVESPICSAQVELHRLLTLTRERLFGECGHQPPRWTKAGESCETLGSQIDVSSDSFRVDETADDRLPEARYLSPWSAATPPVISLPATWLQPHAPTPSPEHRGSSIPELKLRTERFTDLCSVCGTPAHEVCCLCGDKFCHAHMYSCPDCTTVLCGGCMDSHQAEGHWTDSDTAREMSHAITGGAR